MLYAAGAVLLLVIMLLATSGDPAGARSALANVPSDGSMEQRAPAIVIDAPGDEPGVGSDAAGIEPVEIEMVGADVHEPPPPSRTRQPPRKRPPPSTRPPLERPPQDTPASLHAIAMQQLRDSQPRAALATLEQARKQAPNFAPIWFGMGLAYEELGQRGQAKAAFQRYLSLSPRATNADQVRARIEKL